MILDKTKSPFISDKRTGVVRLEDFDIAMLNKLDFKVRDIQASEFEDVSLFTDKIPINQMPRGFTIIPGINAGIDNKLKDEVNILFGVPEYGLNLDILPAFIFRRETVDFAGTRAHGSGLSYRIGADNARVVTNEDGTVIGFSSLEEHNSAKPVDIFYVIDMFAKYRKQVNKMWDFLFSKFSIFGGPQSGGGIFVKDSEGDLRHYVTVFQGFSEVTEIPTIAAKIIGYSVVIIVQAELDDSVPVVFNTVKKINIRAGNL